MSLPKTIYKAGKVLTPLGMVMLFIGAIGWVYRIENPILSNIARYSFYFWLPVLLFGIVFLSFKKVAK